MSDISTQNSEEITAEKLFEIYQQAVNGMIEKVPVKPGSRFQYDIPADACACLVGYVELEDGRTAQVIIKVTCDDDDW
ncbi:MAG: hypothetical protein HWE07_13335 [Cytophagia bacterium]|nr:hypothetical protein [Cytophagia bacterium]